jgi:predicted nucleotidyltransferase
MTAGYEKYIRAWRQRDLRRQERRKAAAARAMTAARAAAGILVEEFGAAEVTLFGSLATGSFREGSDIDLAVKGLRKQDYWKALVRIEEGHEFEVNLVQYEEAFDHIRRAIDLGIVLSTGGKR